MKRSIFDYDESSDKGGETPPAPVGTSSSTSSEGTDYKSMYQSLKAKVDEGKEYISHVRYAALQATMQTTADQKKQFELEATTAKQKIAELENLRDALTTQLNEAQTTKDTVAKEKETLTRKLSRHQILMTSYPELAIFEAKGLIPESPDGKDEEIFKVFSEQINSVAVRAKGEFGKGGAPTPPPPAGQNTPKQEGNALLAQATAKALAGDREGYDALIDQYHALQPATTP
jgi:hypothetical protein